MVCAICQTPLPATRSKIHRCPECSSPYHQECWQENQGCSVYGCAQVPETEHLHAIEIPVSYWGDERKPCPHCGEEILAAAIRCRHCGARFSTAAPMERAEFQQHQALEKRLPALRKKVIWRTIFSILPCTAPLAALVVPFWYKRNARDIAALPALYSGLCKVAMGVAIAQTALVLFSMLLYTAFGSAQP